MVRLSFFSSGSSHRRRRGEAGEGRQAGAEEGRRGRRGEGREEGREEGRGEGRGEARGEARGEEAALLQVDWRRAAGGVGLHVDITGRRLHISIRVGAEIALPL